MSVRMEEWRPRFFCKSHQRGDCVKNRLSRPSTDPVSVEA